MNVFGCELAPTPAVSDYYTFCTGGSSVKDTMLPSLKKVEDNANKPTNATEGTKTPFVELYHARKSSSGGQNSSNFLLRFRKYLLLSALPPVWSG